MFDWVALGCASIRSIGGTCRVGKSCCRAELEMQSETSAPLKFAPEPDLLHASARSPPSSGAAAHGTQSRDRKLQAPERHTPGDILQDGARRLPLPVARETVHERPARGGAARPPHPVPVRRPPPPRAAESVRSIRCAAPRCIYDRAGEGERAGARDCARGGCSLNLGAWPGAAGGAAV